MPSPRIDKQLTDETYFVTFTVNQWLDVFTSETYFDLLISNLKFYIKEYNIELFGYVIMTNHMHLIARCANMIRFIRSYKGFTCKKIIEVVKNDSRKYILPLLMKQKCYSFQVWQPQNWPELVESEKFFQQKLNYIHQNPVIKGYVEREEDWKYSSARNYYCNDHSILEVEIL